MLELRAPPGRMYTHSAIEEGQGKLSVGAFSVLAEKGLGQ